jgi:glutamate synthase (NADPH/NADH) small chain
MLKQDPKTRIHNWNETYIPIELEVAKLEAQRCIQCPNAPCTKACPLGNDIAGALWKLEQGDVMGAAEVFHETSNLPEICGRVCPQEQLCEGDCVVGKKHPPVAIGRLEAFAADHYRKNGGYEVKTTPEPTGKRVAVVGAGPAGLAVAEELAQDGHQITVFDSWSEGGGVLRYGIPTFKLQKELLDEYLERLSKMGIEFVGNTYVGRDISIDALFEQGFDAVFLGHGASKGSRLDVPGGDLPGVILATEYLVRGNLPPEQLPKSMREPLAESKQALVIGGGDTAMDCVRTAKRLGAKEVTCVYRRTEAEMPGRKDERVHAWEEEVRVEYLAAPLRFEAGPDGRVARAHFGRTELGEPDESGRRRPVPTGEEFVVEADTIVIAIGYRVDDEVAGSAELECNWDQVVVGEETGQTSRPGVYAGGDCVNGADLVVTALAGARRAVRSMRTYLAEKA